MRNRTSSRGALVGSIAPMSKSIRANVLPWVADAFLAEGSKRGLQGEHLVNYVGEKLVQAGNAVDEMERSSRSGRREQPGV